MEKEDKRLWILGIALLVGIGGILYGYDIGVISGALLFIYQSIPMSDAQTGIVVGAVLAGGLGGTLISGPLADKLGRRIVIAISSLVFIVGVFLILLANTFLTILIARLLLGIGIGIAILNQWTGINIFLQYAPDILKRSGLGSNIASMLGSVGIGMINFVCTIVAIFLIDKVGRKPLLTTGVIGILISEIFLGCVNDATMTSSTIGILSLLGLLSFTVFFAIGPGVVVWLAISELLPTRVRGKGMALCLFFSSLAGSIISSAFPTLRYWLGMSGTYWLCAGFALFYVLITLFLLPETKAKSLEDIQRYFQDQVETEVEVQSILET